MNFFKIRLEVLVPEFVYSGILSFWTIKKTLKEICEKAKGWLIEIGPDQVKVGMEAFKTEVCRGVEDEDEEVEKVEDEDEEVEVEDETTKEDEDVKEAKDETESGFQTNFLSATLIALCALFKL